MLRSMYKIHQGKELNVASHRLRSEDLELRSLNFARNKQVAMTTDKQNEQILNRIQNAKTGIPSNQSLQKEWNQKQFYRRNL